MRIVIDLDGTICHIKKPEQSYSEVTPIPGTIEKLKTLKKEGHYIIIFTARHMKTCDGNTGKILARVGKITLDWLHKHDVPYDEIYFGKPHGDIYIDDLAMKFVNWELVHQTISEIMVEENSKK